MFLHFIGAAFQSLTLRLKMRDQQTSAALGLPPRINDEDCSVPRLVPSDLAETDTVPDTDTFGKQQEHHIYYPIEMAELAKIRMLAPLRICGCDAAHLMEHSA